MSSPKLRISMIGTRGVPARYGGFETAVEEIGSRLAATGHVVTVYCRRHELRPSQHLGMNLVHLPALRMRAFETLSHTALSVLHALRHPPDAVFLFNAANAIFIPLLRMRGIPTALHMDGLESRRAKWGRVGKAYYRLSERLGVAWAQEIVADAEGIRTYYKNTYGRDSTLLRYGMPKSPRRAVDGIAILGLERHGYHLVVARFEPENHVLEAVQAASARTDGLPLVVVGDAPYSDAYRDRIQDAASLRRVKLLGSVYQQDVLNSLYADAASYVHGHSVGGTNPSLLRALAAQVPILAHDNIFNREVAGQAAEYWTDPQDLAEAMAKLEFDRETHVRRVIEHAECVRAVYDWDTVTAGYEALAFALTSRP